MDIILRKPSEKETQELEKCPVWECKPSSFHWYYDANETSLIIEGDATVEFEGGSVTLAPGDFVVFPKGLSCIWHVKETIKKHYMLKQPGGM